LTAETKAIPNVVALCESVQFFGAHFHSVSGELRFPVLLAAAEQDVEHHLHVIGLDVLLKAPRLEVSLVLSRAKVED
jgi:hypothetical protein